ncbi:V-set and transmembrane domain-containing protein 5-like isoform X2 [Acipenser ruthenus]|uniref:V-set and transmembrane domain-containing protein 5 n=1 Tax=Acipenser ruthenus TaxID=7906 RepID=UPI001561A309|nr:V-set and transmembrane domain-containing protein 5 [Acipenser ruthenus]XP_058885625.1 V-set and transmembrane domain-containing protein 5-like isoform X2 [Acipenser ruthenus]
MSKWEKDTCVPVLLFILFIVDYSLQAQGVTIIIPNQVINATVEESALLSVEYLCQGTPTIQWSVLSIWKIQNIVVWEPKKQPNISESYKDRLCTYSNGSIQILNLRENDSGYYVVTVTDHFGTSKDAAIFLKVDVHIYEDLHFVAVILTVLVAISGFSMFLIWLLEKCVQMIKRKRWKQKIRKEAEEIELQSL